MGFSSLVVSTPWPDVGLDGGWSALRPVMVVLEVLVLAWAIWSMRRAVTRARARVRDAAVLVGQARSTVAAGEQARSELRHDAVNSLAGIQAALLAVGAGAPDPLRQALRSELLHLERLVLGADDRARSFAVDELVREAALLCASQGVDVQVDAQPAIGHGRPTDVRRVVANLFANARRHGAGPVAVAVRLADCGVEVSVSDSGPGVPESIADRVFERGVTGDPHQGSGLGLHVSRRLLRDQRGDLDLRRHDHGVTFAMSLPSGGGLAPVPPRGARPETR